MYSSLGCWLLLTGAPYSKMEMETIWGYWAETNAILVGANATVPASRDAAGVETPTSSPAGVNLSEIPIGTARASSCNVQANRPRHQLHTSWPGSLLYLMRQSPQPSWTGVAASCQRPSVLVPAWLRRKCHGAICRSRTVWSDCSLERMVAHGLSQLAQCLRWICLLGGWRVPPQHLVVVDRQFTQVRDITTGQLPAKVSRILPKDLRLDPHLLFCRRRAQVPQKWQAGGFCTWTF